jgi:hypothetical protein
MGLQVIVLCIPARIACILSVPCASRLQSVDVQRSPATCDLHSTTLYKLESYCDSYTHRLRELERALVEEQVRVRTLVWPSAFVTFK